MAIIYLIYGVLGALGYFAFGDYAKDIITANLGDGSASTLVQLGLCINLLFTFPLMMNPVYEIAERRYWGGSRYCLWIGWVLVLVVSLVALLVPNLADFLSLVGISVLQIGICFTPLYTRKRWVRKADLWMLGLCHWNLFFLLLELGQLLRKLFVMV